MPACVIGKYCMKHNFIHGGEAEELRQRIEALLSDSENLKKNQLISSINHILEDVDARDALAYLEAIGGCDITGCVHHDNPDCPCGHDAGVAGPCGGCNCCDI